MQNRRDYKIFFQMGFCYGMIGDHKKEIDLYLKAIKISPNSAIAYHNLYVALCDDKRCGEILETFQGLSVNNPNSFFPHLYSGVRNGELGNFHEAIGYYERAIEIKPDYGLTYRNLGVIYNRMEQFIEAAKSFENAVQMKPESFIHHFYLALSYLKIKFYEKARDTFKQTILLKPDFVNAHLYLGLTFFKIKKFPQALDEFALTLKLKPELRIVHFYSGLTYLLMDSIELAEKEQKKLKGLDNELACELSGFIYLYKNGKLDKKDF